MERSATIDPLVGQLLDGRYRIGDRIARGGMATVYEATDLRLDRQVAIKVMPHPLADDQAFTQRFVREARAAARLTHPNVVAVYDQGDDDGTLFLAMEYVAGRHTLRDLIRDEAPLPPRRALTLLEEILKAIAAAHESGIVHRDVKPENVLINPRGQVKVADFGLARAISSATTATATGGVLMGTVSYLPPELVTDGTADARSDVYSLGVLLFEMLTGRKPHVGDSAIQVAYKHVHDDVPPPSAFVPDIPPYLDAFVARATARQRDLRPADAHVMLQQLRRVRQAIDSGVLDDQELTDDLTPTVAIGGFPTVLPPDPMPAQDAASTISLTAVAGETAIAPDRADEVFDFTRYNDFAEPSIPAFVPPPPHEQTLVVGRSGHKPPFEASARPRRRKGGWIAALVVLLLATAAAFGGWWFGVGRFTSTPDVVSLSQDAARVQVEDAGLTFKVTSSAYSETIKPGLVVSTDPSAGDRIKPGGVVSAVISKGPERHDVPDLDDKTESQAISLINAAHLSVAEPQRRWNNSVDRGGVISYTPAAGTPLKRDAPVHLVISRGPRPVAIDDFTGKPADQAEKALREAGLDVSRSEKYDDDVPTGVVIRQSPSKGRGHVGDTVRLVVSRGPHLVEVPDVTQYGVAAAQAALQDAGFQVEVVHHTPYFGLGFVVDQSVAGGDSAPFGSTITIGIV